MSTNKRNLFRTRKTTDTIVVHCSATRPSSDIGATEIDRWHRQRGWLGCGYHVVIRRDGTIEADFTGHTQTRPIWAPGAHAGADMNGRSIGICMVGGVREDNPNKAQNNFTPEQFASLEKVIGLLRAKEPGIAQVIGHRDVPNTPKACPSFDVRTWMRERGITPEAQRLSDEQKIKKIQTNEENPTDADDYFVYVIKKGDALWRLARRFGTTPGAIQGLNHPIDPLKLFVGQAIKIPKGD